MAITTLPKADRQKLFFQAEIIAKYKKHYSIIGQINNIVW